MALEGFRKRIMWVFWIICVALESPYWPEEEKRGRARSWGYGNPGKTPGAGGRLNRSNFPFMSSLWGSSCICCSQERSRVRQRKDIRCLDSPTRFQRQDLSSATFSERSEEDRYINNGSMSTIVANSVIQIYVSIRKTISLFTGVQSPIMADTIGISRGSPWRGHTILHTNIFVCVQIINTIT